MSASRSSRLVLSATSLRKIADLVERIDSDEFYDELCRFLKSVVHFDNGVLLVFSSQRPPLVLRQWSSFKPNFFGMFYPQGAYLLDPYYLAGVSAKKSGAYLLKELAPDHFTKSDYYQTYYKKLSMVDEIGFLTPIRSDLTIHLSMGRDLGSKYGAAERDIIVKLEPLVSALLRNHAKLRLPAWDEAMSGSHPAAAESDDKGNGVHWLAHFDTTARETEIASLILQGHSNASIGQVLNISSETVKVHRKRLYAKLSISSQAELFILFMERVRQRPSGAQ